AGGESLRQVAVLRTLAMIAHSSLRQRGLVAIQAGAPLGGVVLLGGLLSVGWAGEALVGGGRAGRAAVFLLSTLRAVGSLGVARGDGVPDPGRYRVVPRHPRRGASGG